VLFHLHEIKIGFSIALAFIVILIPPYTVIKIGSSKAFEFNGYRVLLIISFFIDNGAKN